MIFPILHHTVLCVKVLFYRTEFFLAHFFYLPVMLRRRGAVAYEQLEETIQDAIDYALSDLTPHPLTLIVPRCQQVSEDLISGTSKSVEPKIEVI